MSRMPRVRLILVVAALFALLAVPMASARTEGSRSIHPAGDWIGGVLSWAESLVGLRQSHRPHRQSGPSVPNQKEETVNVVQGGGCVTPDGRPRPLCI